MAKLTDQQIERNMHLVDRAIAQQNLEGLDVSEAGKDDLRRIARGEIDVEEATLNFRRRYQHGQSTCE